MKLFFLLLLARAGVTFSQCHAQLEDACRNVTLLITSKGRFLKEFFLDLLPGYPCEEHIAITPDGFELSMQRIPFGLSNPIRPGEPPRPAVFLQHGFLDASHTWVINNRFESLGFVVRCAGWTCCFYLFIVLICSFFSQLADAGYDVWLGNNRGNIYSNKNTHLSNDTDAFWAFSWDEFAQFDVLTQVDEVLRVNGRSNVTYIGHSQGTSQQLLQCCFDASFANFILPIFSAPQRKCLPRWHRLGPPRFVRASICLWPLRRSPSCRTKRATSSTSPLAFPR